MVLPNKIIVSYNYKKLALSGIADNLLIVSVDAVSIRWSTLERRQRRRTPHQFIYSLQANFMTPENLFQLLSQTNFLDSRFYS